MAEHVPIDLALDLLVSAVPSRWMIERGFDPDPWQAKVADSRAPLSLICCSRQAGKSTIVGGIAAHTIETKPGSLVLIVAPSERQSQELLLKAKWFLSVEVRPESWGKKFLELPNGSRAFALPGSEETVRGFSAPDLIIIDEAAMAPDSLYYAIRPMMATVADSSRMIALSTPKGRRGFFFDLWSQEDLSPQDLIAAAGARPRADAGADAGGGARAGGPGARGGGVERTQITVHQIPRISQDWIEEERRMMPDWLFRQEYMCEFVDNELSVFGSDMIADAFRRGQVGGLTELYPDEERMLNGGKFRGVALEL